MKKKEGLKPRNKPYKRIVYIILILILLAIAILFLVNSYQHYSDWKADRQYLKQPDAEIQPWMEFKTIAMRLNIDESQLESILNLSEKVNPHLSLERFCKQYNQSCTDILERLNGFRK